MRILADSNVLIRFLNGDEPDKGFLERLLKKNELYFSPINIAEVKAKSTDKQERDLKELISIGTSLLIDEETGEQAGNYRRQFLEKTKEVYLLDCFIAASCKIYDLTLVTNDVKDYPMKDIKIIKPS